MRSDTALVVDPGFAFGARERRDAGRTVRKQPANRSDVINPAYGTTRVDTEAPFRIALIELGA
jgi:hypothetical protein